MENRIFLWQDHTERDVCRDNDLVSDGIACAGLVPVILFDRPHCDGSELGWVFAASMLEVGVLFNPFPLEIVCNATVGPSTFLSYLQNRHHHCSRTTRLRYSSLGSRRRQSWREILKCLPS
jgi:hypothetical protein